MTFLVPLLFALCVLRLWLMPLPSSFWLDEMATVFVTRYGASHPSLEIAAPQAWTSFYYHFPRASAALFGQSEIAYRLPSILCMAAALFFIARLAQRLIHPESACLVMAVCFAIPGIDYHAADARPYALGILLAAASLFFLVRWLDSASLTDAILFLAAAGLLWRVHLLFWPLYPVFVLYAIARRAPRRQAILVFSILAVILLPVLRDALTLAREAGAHVIAPLPSLRELAASLRIFLLAALLAAAWIFRRHRAVPASALVLILGWWLSSPLGLFALSWVSGHSVFVPRYFSLALPGAALVITLLLARLLPQPCWRFAAAIIAAAALLSAGQWTRLWPRHHNSDWRAAAQSVNQLAADPSVTVLCPSPFREAVAPVWSPDYKLPGFLYAHLDVYPVHGKIAILPFEGPAPLPASGRIVIYGWEPQVNAWTARLSGWTPQSLQRFADVSVVLLTAP